ncbi:monocarboxylate transporter 9-like [Babylonia areolata]|uniref:monocarboxylate transporter 9-like n=1 Tax=Babylonia areolata TaxID=304850 RepID=UPI003FD6A2EC
MAQSVKDSKDYTSVSCEEPHRDQKDRQQKGSVNSQTLHSAKLSSSSSSSSSESSLVAFSDAFGLPPAPDGGWGWFIVLGAFVISLICDGCAFSFGVMFVYLVDEFQETKSQTAWVASIFYCLSLLLGPVASALVTRFGCRSVTVVAGVLACLGFVASSYVTSIWQLYFTFGVIVGASFSVCYVTSVLIVAYYFDKRRALATGLSVCGTGIGTFTFAPLCEFLGSLYGWRGTFLIMGAISLNICVCGALFRPLTFTPEQRRQRHLTAFQRLTRPVSRLSIPSRNRSRLHSTNSESSSSSSSDSEDEIAALACSQITLPTFVNADKESIQMYLDKLPELRRTTADPQLALQRFFKSRDIQLTNAQSRGSSSESATKSNHIKGKSAKDDPHCEGDSEEILTESKEKRKKKKSSSRKKDKTEVSQGLSEKSMQQLTEKLLEGSPEPGDVQVQISKCCQTEKDIMLETSGMPARTLERTQSEKTPNKLQCKSESGTVLERSLSDKIPAKLICQGDTVVDRHMLPKSASDHRHKEVTNAPPASCIEPSSGSSNVGMLLMNKHSTYLILHRNDIFFRGSRAQKPIPCATSCPELSRLPSDSESEDENCLVYHCPHLEPVVNTMENTFDRKIMGHPLFMLLALSNFFLYFWADVPYVFATDFALSRGIQESHATFLISVIGIVNTVGQVIYGLVGDQDWNLTVIYGISCIGSGLAVVLLPTAKSYWLMGVLCGLFGFFLSANFSLMTVMLVSYLGLEKLAHAYGLIMMIQGLANLGGPPVAGWIVDSSGDYNLAFPIAGGFIMMSGIIIFFLYIIRLCDRFCQYCCVHQSLWRRQTEDGAGSSSKNNNDAVVWISGPPAAGQTVV